MLTPVEDSGSADRRPMHTARPQQFELRAFICPSVCISLTFQNSPINSGLKILRKAMSGEYRTIEGAAEIRARRKVNV